MKYLHSFILFICLISSFAHNAGWLIMPANLEVVAFIVWMILIWVSCDKADEALRSFMFVVVTLMFLIGNIDGKSIGLDQDGQYKWGYIFGWHVFYLLVTFFSVWDWMETERYQRRERKRQAALAARAHA